MRPERLTQERSDRTWLLFRVSWYLNIALVVTSLFLALFFFSKVWKGEAGNIAAGTAIFTGFVVIACILLMGAGICRFQARLEGQNLEIKLAIRDLGEELDEVRALLGKTAAEPSAANPGEPR